MRTQGTIRVAHLENCGQLCLHALTGRAPDTKMCAHNYECGTCPYDQMLDDVAEARIDATPRTSLAVRAA